MFVDIDLFVPIGVQLHAALLHSYTSVIFRRVKGQSRKVTFHGSSCYIHWKQRLRDWSLQRGTWVHFPDLRLHTCHVAIVSEQ